MIRRNYSLSKRLFAYLAALGLAMPAAARADIDAWYVLIDSTGPGEGVAVEQQGEAGVPLIVTTDDEPGVYEFTIRFVADVPEPEAIIAYSVDLLAPDDATISATDLTYLIDFMGDDFFTLGSGPGTIIGNAGQFNLFSSESGVLELFEFVVQISEPPSGDVELFSGIGSLGWATFLGTPLNIVFADSDPLDGSVGGLISSTPSIIIRPAGPAGGADCNANDIPDECDLDCGTPGGPCDVPGCGESRDCNGTGVPDECEVHNCCETGHGAGCSNPSIEACVCTIDPFCCTDDWDDICADLVISEGCGTCEGTEDCNGNGVPDDCEPDCNGNGVPDQCDITAGTSPDVNDNGIPDECEPDCNNNDIPDDQDIADGTSPDCQDDGIPDECQLGQTIVEVVLDGSFEDGTPNGFWTEASTNFGSPLCTIDLCGAGGGSGPRTGDWWAWFGGSDGAFEAGSLEQTVTIPAGTATLEFYLEIPVSSGNGTDFVRALIDGDQLFESLEGNPTYASGYALVSLDVSAYADGGPHLLRFESEMSGVPTWTNFFIDDVSLEVSSSSAGTDCNQNGVPDDCDVDPTDPDGNGQVSPDCQPNGIPDDCDIASGFSLDDDGDGVPDECAPDPGSCQDNGECEQDEYCAKATGDCAGSSGTCQPRPEVCTLEWDPVCGCDGDTYTNECSAAAAGISVDHAGECGCPDACDDDNPCTTDECIQSECVHTSLADDTPCPDGDICNGQETCQSGSCTDGPDPCPEDQACDDETGECFTDCNANDIPDECDLDCGPPRGPCDVPGCGGSQDCTGTGLPDECELHNCCEDGHGAGCNNSSIEGCVCADDPFCCDDKWDSICAEEVITFGCGTCEGTEDCNGNGIPDDCEPDCNDNAVPDECDLDSADPDGNGLVSADCDDNRTPDECDITAGSPDVNDNGIPDECEPDCNGNDIPDEQDLAGGPSQDCNGNAVPDECDLDPADPDGNGLVSSDCDDNDTPDECDIDPTDPDGDGQVSPDCNANDVPDACDIADRTSVDVNGNGVPDECEADCNDNDIPDDQDLADGTSQDCNGTGVPDECELHNCCADGHGAGCNNSSIERCVCAIDPFCCNDNWDSICAEKVISEGCGTCEGTEDCNGNGIPDDCEPDCNANDVPDACDIADGTSVDANDNGVPDTCESDCNDNGIPDDQDLADGTSADCNDNGILDDCDVAKGTSADVDGNGVPDECNADCNSNDIPDLQDLADQTSADCNGNKVPDECDLADGTSSDADANGIPDECQQAPGGQSPAAGGRIIDRNGLRGFLAFLFNVPVEGGGTLASMPTAVFGVFGIQMGLALTFLEWLNLPIRAILFEITYAVLDAILP